MYASFGHRVMQDRIQTGRRTSDIRRHIRITTTSGPMHAVIIYNITFMHEITMALDKHLVQYLVLKSLEKSRKKEENLMFKRIPQMRLGSAST